MNLLLNKLVEFDKKKIKYENVLYKRFSKLLH